MWRFVKVKVFQEDMIKTLLFIGTGGFLGVFPDSWHRVSCKIIFLQRFLRDLLCECYGMFAYRIDLWFL